MMVVPGQISSHNSYHQNLQNNLQFQNEDNVYLMYLSKTDWSVCLGTILTWDHVDWHAKGVFYEHLRWHFAEICTHSNTICFF